MGFRLQQIERCQNTYQLFVVCCCRCLPLVVFGLLERNLEGWPTGLEPAPFGATIPQGVLQSWGFTPRCERGYVGRWIQSGARSFYDLTNRKG